MSRTVRALGALTLLVLFLVAGPVAAATPAHVSGASLWDSAWQWLVELVLPGDPDGEVAPPEDPGSNGGGDAGGTIDPNGLTVFGVIRESRPEGRPAVR